MVEKWLENPGSATDQSFLHLPSVTLHPNCGIFLNCFKRYLWCINLAHKSGILHQKVVNISWLFLPDKYGWIHTHVCFLLVVNGQSEELFLWLYYTVFLWKQNWMNRTFFFGKMTVPYSVRKTRFLWKSFSLNSTWVVNDEQFTKLNH